MIHRLIPLTGLACGFSQHEFRRGVTGIDLQLLLEFLLGVFRIRRGSREQNSPQPKMDLPLGWILRKNLPVLGRGFFPVPLGFEGFRLQLLSLRGVWRGSGKLLRRSRCQFGIEVRSRIKHFRVVGKFPVQQQQGFDRWLRLIKTHCTTRKQHRGLKLGLLVGDPAHGGSEKRDGLFAPTLVGESDPAVLAYIRREGREGVLVIANVGATTVTAATITSAAGTMPSGTWRPRTLLGGATATPMIVGQDGKLRGYTPLPSLAPQTGYLFALSPTKTR